MDYHLTWSQLLQITNVLCEKKKWPWSLEILIYFSKFHVHYSSDCNGQDDHLSVSVDTTHWPHWAKDQINNGHIFVAGEKEVFAGRQADEMKGFVVSMISICINFDKNFCTKITYWFVWIHYPCMCSVKKHCYQTLPSSAVRLELRESLLVTKAIHVKRKLFLMFHWMTVTTLIMIRAGTNI
jgi:hypothetical protein